MTPQEQLAHWIKHTCRVNPPDLEKRIDRDLGKKSLVSYLKSVGADHLQLDEAIQNTVKMTAKSDG